MEDAFLNTAKQIYANIQNGVIDVSNDVSIHTLVLSSFLYSFLFFTVSPLRELNRNLGSRWGDPLEELKTN